MVTFLVSSQKLGAGKTDHLVESRTGVPCTMRYDDLEAVAQLVQGEEEKERLCQIANELAQQTMRGDLSAYW